MKKKTQTWDKIKMNIKNNNQLIKILKNEKNGEKDNGSN
jgi:hypothetical protein